MSNIDATVCAAVSYTHLAKPNGDDKLLREVVKGMWPNNKLGAKLLGNMYVYAGSEHKHDAQNPKMIDINVLK